jgi:hypothetical protein
VRYKVTLCAQSLKLLLSLLFILTADGVLLGGSGTTIRDNTQITHITQNNTPRSKKHSTQNYTNNKGHTTRNEYNYNYNKNNYNYNYINNANPKKKKKLAKNHACISKIVLNYAKSSATHLSIKCDHALLGLDL